MLHVGSLHGLVRNTGGFGQCRCPRRRAVEFFRWRSEGRFRRSSRPEPRKDRYSGIVEFFLPSLHEKMHLPRNP